MLIDWNLIEGILFQESVRAIEKFQREHPFEKVNTFAYYLNPIYGDFRIYLDTIQNSIMKAEEMDNDVIGEINVQKLLYFAQEGGLLLLLGW